MKQKCMKGLLAVLLLSGTQLYAQNGRIEGGINIGYGGRTASQELVSNTGASQEIVSYSLGAGLNVELTGRMMLGDHLGAGLDLTYVMGTPVKYTTISNNGTVNNNVMQGSLFAITPNLVLSAGNTGVNPYGQFGLVLGVPSFEYSLTQSGDHANSGTYIDQYSGGMAVGWYAAFGLEFPISVNMMLNAQVFDRDMAYAPGQVENTQTFDGDQRAPTITYVNSVDQSTPNDKRLKSYYPFGSAGIKIGIIFLLHP